MVPAPAQDFTFLPSGQAGRALAKLGAGGGTDTAMSNSGIIARSLQANRVNLSWTAVLVYASLHLGCLGVFYTGISAQAIAVLCGAFLLRGLGVSIVYHRYFAHRSFRTSRPMQFILGLFGSLTVLGAPLWWAQTHREHHRHADTPEDIHSPRYQGFIYSHCGWFLDNNHRGVDLSKVRDLTRFPELVWLDRFDLPIKALYVAGCYWLFGIVGVVWGFFLPAVIVLQMIHWIQSVSHSLGGYRRYPTLDDSRNHWMFGVLSLGEGFHHNHHCFPGSARLGLRWWEFDLSFLVLRMLSWLGLVWDLRVPDTEVRGGRDKRADRHPVHVKAEIRKLAYRIYSLLTEFSEDTACSQEIGAACQELVLSLDARINDFSERITSLLVLGPRALQEALDDLWLVLREEMRKTLTPVTDSVRLEGLFGRVDAAILELPPTLRHLTATNRGTHESSRSAQLA
jgi:stearoyl-CoA desaturase (Delta-9 desaturase)